MTREVDGQQTQSVIYSLLNKTPDASPDSASNTSVIYTILSLLNLVKPVQCVFRSIRSRIGIEVRSAIRIHSINRELNFFYRFLTRFFAA
ncbi:hypothetical protein, partial [Escherichia coli]|uniref:hypothetical protein n=1 Tax=Escherichia coli TaxID=562 RepID=UPI00201EC2F9